MIKAGSETVEQSLVHPGQSGKRERHETAQKCTAVWRRQAWDTAGMCPDSNGVGWGPQAISLAGRCCESQVERKSGYARGMRYSTLNHLIQGTHFYFKPWYFLLWSHCLYYPMYFSRFCEHDWLCYNISLWKISEFQKHLFTVYLNDAWERDKKEHKKEP